MRDKNKASHNLLGKTLHNDWVVTGQCENVTSRTGGIYSAYYEVSKGNQRGFLKAFDYSGADLAGASSDEMSKINTAYNYEKHVLETCTRKGIKNVVRFIDAGEIEVPEIEKYPKVVYLILEQGIQSCKALLADPNVDWSWKLISLHQVASGLNQLHRAEIAHQDMKPSNVVTMQDGVSRITDFGSASYKTHPINPPAFLNLYQGTREYAPPELLYGGGIGNGQNPFESLQRPCDAYLLGSMIVFYFSNISMTALIQNNLAPQWSWNQAANQGNYSVVKPYVSMAFAKAMEDFAEEMKIYPFHSELVDSVRYLCNPDPYQRGHPKGLHLKIGQHSLERFVSILARLVFAYTNRAA